MSPRIHRTRGESLGAVLFALGLLTVVVASLAQRVASQARELRFTSEEARARSALLDAHERLRAGLVAVPAPDGAVSVAAPAGLDVRVERVPGPLDPALARTGGVVAVRVRVAWRSVEGMTRARELVTLVGEAAR